MLTVGCLEPFEANVSSGDRNILVVDGFINVGPGITKITLSRVTPLSTSVLDAEENAQVAIESNDGEIFSLDGSARGIYSGNLNLPTQGKYRLIIITEGKEYHSEFTTVKITPPIDSIHWEWSDVLKIMVNAHDDNNKTQYYRWEYEETWQIVSPFDALYIWEDDTIKKRPVAERVAIRNCWNTAKPNTLLMSTTTGLINDRVSSALTSLPHGSVKTSERYSILVNQHTIQKEEYEYLKIILKNSTQMGSFFDSQPSQFFGNIRSVSQSDEFVIGYVGAYTTETKRFFISKDELPQTPIGNNCLSPIHRIAPEFKINDPDSLKKYLKPNLYYVPYRTWVDQYGEPWMQLINKNCVDCRAFGSNVRPDFW